MGVSSSLSVPTDIGSNVIEKIAQSDRFPVTTKVYQISILSGSVPVTDIALGEADPFFQLSLTPSDPLFELIYSSTQMERYVLLLTMLVALQLFNYNTSKEHLCSLAQQSQYGILPRYFK